MIHWILVNLHFTITQYPESAIYITDKAKQDTYYYNQLVASFLPKMRRAIEENLETNILALQSGQTVNNANSINTASHRFVARGNTNTTLALEDFAYAKFALDRQRQPRLALLLLTRRKSSFLTLSQTL